jgi:hypothetical protein
MIFLLGAGSEFARDWRHRIRLPGLFCTQTVVVGNKTNSNARRKSVLERW